MATTTTKTEHPGKVRHGRLRRYDLDWGTVSVDIHLRWLSQKLQEHKAACLMQDCHPRAVLMSDINLLLDWRKQYEAYARWVVSSMSRVAIVEPREVT